MSNWSKPYNDITWRNGSAPYLNAENLNENQSWIKELDSRTKELYARTDTAEPGGIARDVYYDNGTSGLDANNVQDAIDKSSDLRNVTGGNIWSATASYTVGQRVYYGRELYRCIVANTGIAPGNDTYWTKITLTTLNTDIVNLQGNSLKHKTVTGTTDGNGLIGLGVDKSRVYAAFIASNTGTDGKYVITPAASSNTYVRIVSAVSGANVANYGITINVLYI